MDEKKLYQGWLSWEETPSRLEAWQKEIYQSSDLSSVGIINRCAGMKLDFFTELREISFRFQCEAFLRDYVCFDCYEDGVYTESISFPDRTNQGIFYYQKKKTGRVWLEIYLPNACDTRIFELPSGQMEAAQRPTKTYLALGDSITQGLNARKPSFTYPTLLARAKGYDLLNQGVGGYVFDQRVISKNLSADLITFAYGVNDCYLLSTGEKHREEIETDIKSFFRS